MIRRFNYTKRLKIFQKDIVITIIDNDNGRLSFEANLSKLVSYEFSEDCSVFIEAYRQMDLKRFDYGRVGAIVESTDRDLSNFGTKDGILFRVKITDEKTGRIIAEADRIPFVTPNQQENPRLPLLPVCPKNLGDQIFRVDYTGPRTILEINIEAISPNQIAHDPAFIALAYPVIVKEILTRILLIERYFDITDEDDWMSNWLQFANSFPGIGEMPSESDPKDTCYEWIDNVVLAFCKRQQVRRNFSEVWSVTHEG
jgi:hypothetical protein